tara:strand:- start:495 stop:1151 length:657 start_codon:yes stop_codon:yes gene_type:complete
MGIPTGSVLYTQGNGSAPENVEIPVYSQRDPSPIDVRYPVGKRWINQVDNLEWVLTSFSSSGGNTLATWTNLVGAEETGAVTSLSTDEGTSPVFPTNGNIAIVGDSNNLSTAGGIASVTINMSNELKLNTLTLGSSGGQIIITDQDTSTSSIGQAVLSGGTVTVTTSACTSTSLVFITPLFYEGSVGATYVETVSNGSFVLRSTNGGDASRYSYLIIN